MFPYDDKAYPMSDLILHSLIMGCVATAAMDVWAIILKLVFGLPTANWTLIGRWFVYVPRGRIFHGDIGQTPSVRFETAIGWIAHYVIGIIYAAALLVWGGADWMAAPTFLPALIVGWVTVGAGWFLLQPGMGAGWAANKRANKWQVRFLNVVGHTVFAIGLFGAALALV